MGKGARIKRLKEEQAKLLMAAKTVGPKINPKHVEMILAIIRAFELQHRTMVADAPILAQYISQAHHGALQKGFFAYHNDLMQAIDVYFEKKFPDDPAMGGIKRGLIDFLNLPGKDDAGNKPQSEEPGDGHREEGSEEVHPLEQGEDEDPRNASDEIGGGITRIGDQNLRSPKIGPTDPEEKKENS